MPAGDYDDAPRVWSWITPKAAKGVDARDIPPDSLTKTSSIAEAYWFAHQQKRDGWTHELDLRPSVEKW